MDKVGTTEPKGDTMPTLKVRPGVLENIQQKSGIKANDAFARSLMVTPDTITRAKNGGNISAGFLAVICHVYGLTPNDVAEVAPDNTHPQQVAA